MRPHAKLAVTMLALLLGASSSVVGQAPAPSSLAPFELFADGFTDLRGIAVDTVGNVLVADRADGSVIRIPPGGGRQVVVASALERPIGLAFDLDGRLLVAEERAARVVRLESNGTRTTLVSGIQQPRWLAMHEDGSLFISVRALARGTEPEPDDESAEPVTIVRLAPTGQLSVFADGFKMLQGLAVSTDALFAATQGRRDDGSSDGVVFRIPILADGSAGPAVQYGNGDQFKKPVGLALDRLGALYLTTNELTVLEDRSKRVVAKLHLDSHVTSFAENLGKPYGLAFDTDGNLFLADGNAGRVVKFRAPAAPTLSVPAFTNQSPITVTGSTSPGGRVDVFPRHAAAPVTVVADAAGTFVVGLSLIADSENVLEAFATGHGGDALTSVQATATIVHDGTAPSLAFQAPPTGAHVRQTVGVQAQASDGGSQVASLTLGVGATPLPTTTLTPAPPVPSVSASADWNTVTVPDGVHTLSATATDRAGNQATIPRVVTVDNTPPDTQISSGPSGDTIETTAAFAFAGSDNLTPAASLLFAWRLDGSTFTAFSTRTSVTLDGLSEGPHVFEVKARDLAGNEDPAPASRSFTLASGPSIASLEPASGFAGTLVTIAGDRFEPGGTQVALDGVRAIVRTISAGSITAIVPIGATSGPLTITTSRGTASRAFTVTTTGDFAVAVSPATVPVVRGTTVDLSVGVPATGSYSGLITLGATAPAGVSAHFSTPALGPNGTAILTLTTTASAPPGSSAITVTATAAIDGRTITRSATASLDVREPGQTMVAGRLRDEQDLPLAGVRIGLGGPAITQLGSTDAGGNFLIPVGVTGPQTLLIDGSALNTADVFYPTIPVTVHIQPGVVNTLEYTPRLRAMPAAKLTPLTPGQPAVVTDPAIPGFTMRVPAGVRIIGWDGQANTRVGVTQVPLDRSPLPPPPSGVTARFHYLFNFGKVGGGTPTGPVVIDPPNDLGLLPGTPVELYYFNEAPDGTAPNQWERYGTATVSEDGRSILTDVNPATGERYGIPRFCCGGMMINATASVENTAGGGASGGPSGGGKAAAEPVDTVTGFLYVEKTDLVLPGRLPVTIHRTYRSELRNQGVFGLGTSWPYDVFLQPPDGRPVADGAAPSLILYTPGNRQDLFARQADGTFVNTTAPPLRAAVVTPSPTGRTLRFKDGRRWQFDPAGRLASQSDRNGNTVTMTRDGQGRVTTLTSPDGRQLHLSYTGLNLRADSITDPLLRQVRYGYDAQGRLETVTDPAGGETRYTYDAGHRVLTIRDPRGITFLTNEYDASGRVVRQVQADGGEWRLAYQVQGRAVVAAAVTDPRGNTTTYRFNPAGYLVSETDALGQTATYAREPATNVVLAVTDALGRVTRNTYDSQGNVTSITDAAGRARGFTYEPIFNQLESITDALGNVTGFGHDAQGNLTSITDPSGAVTKIAYNPSGQPVSITDALGNTTGFEYDAAGNLTATVDPLGRRTTRVYDAASRLIRQRDPRGYATRFGYDPLNRLTEITDPLSGLMRFGYDGNGNLRTVTDARGNATGLTYDEMDRLASRTDPVGATELFAYDGAGNLVQHTDRKGQVATFTYDPLNRRTGGVYADATTSFFYDPAGRLIEATDSAGGTILNQYDLLDRMTAQTQALGTIGYAYDAVGRRTRMLAPGATPVDYTYDAASRLRTISQAPLSPATIDYDVIGRRTLLTLPNQVSTEYQYDAASGITALIYRNALGTLGELTYEYDTAGRRTRIGGSFARTGLPQPLASATYDPANRQAAFGAQALTYDANGNVTSQGATTYTWDARNQLRSVVGPTTESFVYDPLGRRTSKTVNGANQQFLYDGVDVEGEVEARPVSYLRALRIDEALARGGDEFYLTEALGSVIAVTDVVGRIVTSYTYEPFAATSVNGTPSENPAQFTGRENDGTGLYYYRARYLAPGLARFLSEDPLRSPSFDSRRCRQHRPDATDLVALDPTTTRVFGLTFFGVPIPAEAVGAPDPAKFHLYAYATNNPIGNVDPLGLDAAEQNNGCDRLKDVSPFNSPCAEKCCNEHDSCFKQMPGYCSELTWILTAMGYRGGCNDCNRDVVVCLTANGIKGRLGGRKDCL